MPNAAQLFEMKSTYLNSAYMGPLPIKAKLRVEEALRQAMDPAFSNFEERTKTTTEIRAKFGQLLGTPAQDIALSTSVSELVSHVANGLELHQGDNVILMKGDYPSMVLPWMVTAENKGIHIHFVERETFQQPHLLAAEINDRTRFVGCSHVMFNTGLLMPIAEIAKICRPKEVLFLADVSQAFGAIRIAPEIIKHVDILVGVAYKWLLGPYGTAFGYFSPQALTQVRRTHASWLISVNSKSTEYLLDYTTETIPGACRFDRGQSSVYLLNAGLAGALDVLLDVGLEKIEEHNLSLTRHFLEHLPKDFHVLGSGDCPIVCFKSPRAEAATLKKTLAEKGIDVSVREGYLRASFHFFNTREQADQLLKCL